MPHQSHDARMPMPLDSIVAFGALNNPDVRKGHHASQEAAEAAGLRGPVAYSLHYAGFVADLLTRRVGRRWSEEGALSLAFVRPVYAGDLLEVRIGERPLQWPEASPPSAHQVDVYNQLGELVAAGSVHLGGGFVA